MWLLAGYPKVFASYSQVVGHPPKSAAPVATKSVTPQPSKIAYRMIELKSHRRTHHRAATNGRVTTVASSTRRRPQEGLKFTRVFSQKAIAPFDELEWELRTAEITDDSGKAIF